MKSDDRNERDEKYERERESVSTDNYRSLKHRKSLLLDPPLLVLARFSSRIFLFFFFFLLSIILLRGYDKLVRQNLITFAMKR